VGELGTRRKENADKDCSVVVAGRPAAVTNPPARRIPERIKDFETCMGALPFIFIGAGWAALSLPAIAVAASNGRSLTAA